MLFSESRPFVRFARYMKTDESSNFPLSFPLDARLFYCVGGIGKIKIADDIKTLEESSVLIINSGCSYQIMPSRAEYIILNFDFTYNNSNIENPVNPINLLMEKSTKPIEKVEFEDAFNFNEFCLVTDSRSIHPKLQRIVKEYTRKLQYHNEQSSAILFTVLTNILRKSQSKIGVDGRFDINDIVKYINEHYNENLDNLTLSKKYHFHPNYISSEFKKHIGMPLHQYVLETRILMAVSIIESGNKNISEIARLVGFADSNYFTRYFKKIMGTTPGKYIKSFSDI